MVGADEMSLTELTFWAFAIIFTSANSAALELHAGGLSQSWDLHVTTDLSAKAPDDATSKALASVLWVAGGSVSVGSLQETLSYPKLGQYRIKSDIHGGKVLETVWSNSHDLRFSQGVIGAAHLETTRFYDKRGDRDALQTAVDAAKKRVEFFDGQRSVKVEPLKGDTTDLVALPYLFLGRPLPAKPFTVWMVDGKNSREVTFDVSPAPFAIAGTSVDAVKFSARRPRADDAQIEIWVRRSDGMPLHVRVGLNAKYGIVLEENLTAVPPPYLPPAEGARK
jgi:hypothetical protein